MAKRSLLSRCPS